MDGIRLASAILLLLLNTQFAFGRRLSGRNTNSQCGYSSCPATKQGFINVHLIPHSHDDVGWLKTVDQYYFGSRSSTQKAGVQYILDSVVQELKRDPNKRFIYVETAFFWKWWKLQSEEIQKEVQDLVGSGQLEFISGGWSMHDEATSHYQSIVDQFTWGFRKLNDTFGKCGVPRVGWQIDPFGHSRETASLMARLGFDGLLLGRIDHQDKAQRMIHKTMEMVWEASPNLGKEADLFTGVLYNTYSPPPGFCFDILCNDQPIVDDKSSPEYNAEARATDFLREIANMKDTYKSKGHLAITMGGDFTYQDAHYYFVNTDRLIRAVNARQTTHNSDINLLYSTPSCYLKSLNSEGIQFPTKNDDFFPYSSDPHAYWTGYFTSRPTLKRFERIGNNLLQVCKQTAALSNLDANVTEGIDTLREAMGVMQHHDAVSGTEKQHVANDYARRLSEGLDQCGSISEAALNKFMRKDHSSPPLTLTSCMLLNISQCEISEKEKTFVVTLYNPLSRAVSHYVRLPVPTDNPALAVYDNQGQRLEVQTVPVPDPVTKVPGRFSEASLEVVFKATDIPPLGYRSYYVTQSNKLTAHVRSRPVHGRNITIGQGSVKLTIDSTSGLPTKLYMPGRADPMGFHQDFYYFQSAAGDNQVNNRSSGAYILRPNSSYFMVNPQPQVKYYSGPLFDELHQEFSSWVSQVIRVYRDEDRLDFNWLVGPIPISDKLGKELVTRYQVTGMKTNATFYTDSNGREMLQREINQRPSYPVNVQEPVAGNYYPVTSRISIKSKNLTVSLLTDRAEGGTSLHDGEIELMLHRRILHDDGFGVDEALNEEAFGHGLVARGTHYLMTGPSAAQKRFAQALVLAVHTYFTPTTLSLSEWQTLYNMEWSGLKSALPDNVQILTLEPWKDSTYLLRLEHILEANEDNSTDKSVTINLQDIFKPFTINWVRETSLGANQWLDEVSRLVWKKEDNNIDNSETVSHTKPQDVPQVILTPMAIKTFIIQVSFN